MPDDIRDENIYVVCQNKRISGYYATSFEEAFILTNSDNNILNQSLKYIRPNIYKRIAEPDGNVDFKCNITHSFEWQCKLAKLKSDFADDLLYRFIIEDDEKLIPRLPKYIKNGLEDLAERLKGVSKK